MNISQVLLRTCNSCVERNKLDMILFFIMEDRSKIVRVNPKRINENLETFQQDFEVIKGESEKFKN